MIIFAGKSIRKVFVKVIILQKVAASKMEEKVLKLLLKATAQIKFVNRYLEDVLSLVNSRCGIF